MIASLALAGFLTASPTFARTAPTQGPSAVSPGPAPAPVLPPITTPPADVTVLEGATVAPDCGGLYGLQGRAFCVSTLLTGVGALAEAYISDIKAKGWLVVAGDDNRLVLIRRQPDGRCDGLQMQAFYDTAAVVTPTTPGYLAFGVVPGNVCAAQPPVDPAAPDPAPPAR